MSRAALVIICDFLLISLLSLANFDEPARQQVTAPDPTAVDAQAMTNLIEIMQQALEQERTARTETQEQLDAAQRALENREELLAQREDQVREKEQDLTEIERRAQELARERERLRLETEAAQQELTSLQEQQTSAQQKIQELTTNLRVASAEASITRNQSEAIKAELAARRSEVEKLQGQMEKLEQTRQAAESEKQRFAVELTRVQTEATIVREQLSESRDMVRTLNVEKAELREHAATLAQGVDTLAQESQQLNNKLTQSVETLAAKSEEIKTGILQAQPLAPNTIFNDYLTNRLQSAFLARRGAILQDVRRERGTDTVLFSDGTNTFAIYHVDDTPLNEGGRGTDWEVITGSLGRGLNHFPLRELDLTGVDPRLVVAPLPESVVTNLLVKVYSLAQDPFRWQQGVVVGKSEDYYGEVDFQLDPENPVYLKLKRRAIGGLFSGSLPNRKDLVFTRQGELLGLMVNDEYCVLLRPPAITRKVRLGPEIANQQTGTLVDELQTRLRSLPAKLQ
ncbi:MAG: hypothetical protein H7A46_15525 [Verrucomicrobiales bacterium]|nr:hypothetical protein [Verrucomicrobiales bacterium]